MANQSTPHLHPLTVWQAESATEARLLQPDGTHVVREANVQVCILKLRHGNRRVTLAEAEEILWAGGK